MCWAVRAENNATLKLHSGEIRAVTNIIQPAVNILLYCVQVARFARI
ncbi:MAG: hypothetical protein JWM91_4397 [Rhodospirillales bacterium]|nr:hypothetical protein [Rhodospirillales bacterium]